VIGYKLLRTRFDTQSDYPRLLSQAVGCVKTHATATRHPDREGGPHALSAAGEIQKGLDRQLYATGAEGRSLVSA
jgi:hypothetical protein